MQETTGIEDVRRCVRALKASGGGVGLVPTMGNLHDGHMALVARARARCRSVVVSIYVNPLQFGKNEDFGSYPRTLERDRSMLAAAGVDALFLPDEATMYPRGPADQTRVVVPSLGSILEGEFRPTHFQGVTTVVARLLNIVGPDLAFFGRKDYQQLAIIRRMVADLAMPVEIEGVETTRAADGLALSSRNQYLTEAERARAPALYRVLADSARRVQSGEDFAAARRDGLSRLREAGFAPDYLALRTREDLGEPGAGDNELVLLVAARLGRARLIDNLEFTRRP